MSIVSDMKSRNLWEDFLYSKIESSHIDKCDELKIRKFIDENRFEYYASLIEAGEFPTDYPVRKEISKEGSKKKRVIYSFDEENNIVLKFLAHMLHRYDGVFSDNLYSFKKKYGVGDAIKHFAGEERYQNMWCYKADVSNYFNSIDTSLLEKKLLFLKDEDEKLYDTFCRILRERRVYSGRNIVEDNHGAMAGIPVATFFANLYLDEVDKRLEKLGAEYYRYSDDILIFANDEAKMKEYINVLETGLSEHGLYLNPEKVYISIPGEGFEFLGFSYDRGVIDISENTKRKLKAKIKRKSDALRRWARKKNLDYEKGAKGLINAINIKLYGKENEDDFNWSRWFFPHLTTDKSLKELERYIQEYIRYTVTGRHYKGNYRYTYDDLKKWGYKSLVNEYFKHKKVMTN